MTTTRGKQFACRTGEFRAAKALQCGRRNTTCLFSSAEAQFTKRTISYGLFVLLSVLITSGPAQNPPSETEQRLTALVQQIQAQQAQIAANQEKIDTKLAEVTEAVRVARIFAGRGGR